MPCVIDSSLRTANGRIACLTSLLLQGLQKTFAWQMTFQDADIRVYRAVVFEGRCRNFSGTDLFICSGTEDFTVGDTTGIRVYRRLPISCDTCKGALRLRFVEWTQSSPVAAASFFACDPALSAPADLFLPDEAALIAWARAHPGFAWVGDPLLARIPELGRAPHVELPHEAVSSTLFTDRAAALAGPGVLARLTERLLGSV